MGNEVQELTFSPFGNRNAGLVLQHDGPLPQVFPDKTEVD